MKREKNREVEEERPGEQGEMKDGKRKGKERQRGEGEKQKRNGSKGKEERENGGEIKGGTIGVSLR